VLILSNPDLRASQWQKHLLAMREKYTESAAEVTDIDITHHFNSLSLECVRSFYIFTPKTLNQRM
jgi:hypothetical protein